MRVINQTKLIKSSHHLPDVWVGKGGGGETIFNVTWKRGGGEGGGRDGHSGKLHRMYPANPTVFTPDSF